MSDLLAATGWIGEHPVTGADVAHLLLYPATDLDPDSPSKLTALALVVGAVPAGAAGALPVIDAEVDVRGLLRFGGQIVSLPDDPGGEWSAAAIAQGFVVVTITTEPLAAPGLAEVEALVESGAPLWLGMATARQP